MRFTIYAGSPSSDDFTVISSNGITGQLLTPGDTATAKIITKDTFPVCILDNLPLTIIDLDNGVFNLSLTAEQTVLLEPKIGLEEDGYNPRASHELYLDFNLASGFRQAVVDVHVKKVPECQI